MIGLITHTYHDGLHILQRWITEHSNLIGQFLWVIHLVWNIITNIGISCSFSTIASGLSIRKDTQREVKHILFHPHFEAVFCRLVIIYSLWS